MTWKVDSGPGSSPGQVFHRNDGGNGNDERGVAMTWKVDCGFHRNDRGKRATRLPRPSVEGLAMTKEGWQ